VCVCERERERERERDAKVNSALLFFHCLVERERERERDAKVNSALLCFHCLVNLIILFKPHTCIIRKLLLQLSNKEIRIFGTSLGKQGIFEIIK
jgi:hypothetical protein